MKHRPYVMLCLSIPAAGTASPHFETFANGLRVVVASDHSAPVAAVYFFVGVGSSFEDNYLGTGISHYVEHTVSEGTKTRTYEEITRTRADLGNNSNAYTTRYNTAYFVITSGSQVIEAVDHIADYVFHPTFPQEGVDKHRGIIHREIARGEDDPRRQLHHLFARTAFLSSPERYPIIGFREQFDTLTRDDLVAFHTRHYVPGNVVVAVVGDFSAEEVADHLRETLGSLPRAAYHRPIIAQEAHQVTAREAFRKVPGLGRTYVMFGYPTVNLFNSDMYPLDVAAYILGNGASSRLVSSLRDDLGLVDSIGVYSHTPHYDAGTFNIMAITDEERLPAVRAAVAEEIARLHKEPVSEAELARARRQKEADLVFARQTFEDRAAMYGLDVLLTGDPTFSDQYVEHIRNVTAEQVMRVVQTYLQPSGLTVAVLHPESADKPAPVTTAAPTAAPGGISTRSLDNGLRLVVQESRSVPVVTVFAACLGGLRYETEQTAGITSLTANMLTRGTKSRSRTDIAALLEDVGGTIAPFSGRNTYGLSLQVRAEDLPLAIELAADVLRNPIFPAEELEREKQLALAALRAREENVDAVAADLLQATLYTAHPYRFPTVGTAESLAAITREDVAAFHERYCRPNGLVLSVIGDTSVEETLALVERHFGNFAAGDITPPEIAAEPPLTEQRLREMSRDQQQAVVMYGFLGPRIDDEDRYVLDMLNAVFSGIGYPGGRLHKALRGAQLVYATWAYAVPGLDTGYFAVYAGTHPDQVPVVQEEIERIINDLRTAPPSEEEMATARKVAIAAHDIALQSTGDRAQKVTLDELYGLGADRLFHYAENINAVTAQQVYEKARQLLDLEQSAVIITRPAATQ